MKTPARATTAGSRRKPAPRPDVPFHMAARPMGAHCNLGCQYCHSLDQKRTRNSRENAPRMDDTTLESFVRDHIAAQPAGAPVHFAWQGGEPTLLGLDAFRRVVSWQNHYAAGRPVHNTLQTNGTTLDDAWGEFLHAENFLVGLSLDGPREMHDAFRLDARGHPTWERVMAGLKILRRHRVDFNTLTVVHRRNVRQPREVYDFLVRSGSRHLRFIPLVERRPASAESARGLNRGEPDNRPARQVSAHEAEFFATAQSLPPGRFGQFLRTVFDHWVRRDVGRVFVQTFESALSAWAGPGPTQCAHTVRCGRAFTLDHDGEVYSCEHYTCPGLSLGNLHRTPLAAIARGPAADRFADAKAGLSSRCLGCTVRFACNGDCPKHRFVATAPGERPVSYLCSDYGRFLRHIDPAMRVMADLLRAGRPPAEIMRRPLTAPAFG
jgi:uncharacterized protein